ncbi:unnamed protein product [Spirodela intermedia]|uniref:Uncharacterized protein n=1 Tax=Spirodela intermedia TaxID=51605 RepID=A0A7I8JKB2_SPIIN|nr:unnamed protein product [Spirodela intermedia]CAA6670225.1 unnamed protein product [Spirodela intermedia]
MEEDDVRFMVAAQEDDHLVARMLIRLSRSESCISWRKLLSPSRPARRPQLPPTWGKRRTRSRFITMEGVLTAKREETRRASPTTPLSACEEPCSASPSAQTLKNPPARRRKVGFCSSREPAPAELREDGGEIRIPKMESLYEEASPVRAPVGAGSLFGPGSAKVAEAVAGLAPPVGPVVEEETTGRFRAVEDDEVGSVLLVRPGKKRAVPDLRAMEESLLREQEELQKELEKQEEIYHSLRADNVELLRRKLEFGVLRFGCCLRSLWRRFEAERPSAPRMTACFAASEGGPERFPCRISLPFDLNLFPDDD